MALALVHAADGLSDLNANSEHVVEIKWPRRAITENATNAYPMGLAQFDRPRGGAQSPSHLACCARVKRGGSLR